MKKLWDFLGSYGLACVLLGFLFILTFLGTIEQKYEGLYEVQRRYFESVFVVHWLFHAIPLPLPGVYLVLLLLFVNLVVGGIIRIRKSSATLGVIVIHIGILVMLAAGFVKLKFSTDGHLSLLEGRYSDHYVSYYEWEVAIWDAAQVQSVDELIIPEEDFADLEGAKTRTFTTDKIPGLKLELSSFVKNGDILPKGPMWEATGPVIDGFGILAKKPEPEAERNVAALVARVGDKAGFLWPFATYPMIVDAAGKKWAIDLRHKIFKMPFTVTLTKFTHEYYPNTDTPKTYMSDITVTEGASTRPVKIKMNEPLRDGGLVLFQASFAQLPNGQLESTLAVVKNPSDQWPLISCIIIAVGMLMAFVQKLLRYIEAQKVERSKA
ncbi:MAG TPA: cytochrome c biogenesis protein ResB [Planctomycetota bacterium]|nr:cytochrome c biogenesis protein ResB [Planctomycetota bacterium]